MLKIFGLFGLLLFCSRLLAHPTEVCLERVADSSEMLKICQLDQQKAEECNAQKALLQHRMDDCRAALFTEKDIAAALKVGAERIGGDVSKSPYSQNIRSQQALARSVEPNMRAFSLYFPEAGQVGNQIVEHFDTEKCPNRYQGVEKRWNLASVLPVNRFPLTNVVKGADPAAVKILTLYFLQEEAVGECYTGQEGSEIENRFLVVSLPDQVFRQLIRANDKRVLICEDHLCVSDFKALESLYREYQEQYQEFVRYSECSEIISRNQMRLRAKSQPKSVLELPDSCPEQELEVKLKRAWVRVEELDQNLFGAQTVQLVRSNSL